MDEFNKLLLKIKEDLIVTRDGGDVEDVDLMCKYMYYKMKEQEMEKDREIRDLKNALIKSASAL